MARSRLRQSVRVLIIAATAAAGSAMVGTHIYLLAERPVVARSVPEPVPPGWLCGRVAGQPRCVAVSDDDRRWWNRSVTAVLLVIPFFFVVAARAQIARQSRKR